MEKLERDCMEQYKAFVNAQGTIEKLEKDLASTDFDREIFQKMTMERRGDKARLEELEQQTVRLHLDNANLLHRYSALQQSSTKEQQAVQQAKILESQRYPQFI